jgi:hypothetical protein
MYLIGELQTEATVEIFPCEEEKAVSQSSFHPHFVTSAHFPNLYFQVIAAAIALPLFT